MATDPRKWIYAFIDKVPGIISAPARWIADRIWGSFQDSVAFAKWLKSGFEYLTQKAKAGLAALASAADELATSLRWFVTVQVPKLLASTISTLKSWASNVITITANGLKGLINTLRSWAVTAINAVTHTLNLVRDWLLAKINAILDRLHKTVDVWWDRLTDPKKMAAWLIAALMAPLWAYVYANRDKIARWFLRRSIAFTEWLVRELDATLRRIL